MDYGMISKIKKAKMYAEEGADRTPYPDRPHVQRAETDQRTEAKQDDDAGNEDADKRQ